MEVQTCQDDRTDCCGPGFAWRVPGDISEGGGGSANTIFRGKDFFPFRNPISAVLGWGVGRFLELSRGTQSCAVE